jgi:hypothetical protein
MTDHLLAAVVDHLAVLAYLHVKTNAKKGTAVPQPKPLPRPGDALPKPIDEKARHAAIAYLQDKRDRHAREAQEREST